MQQSSPQSTEATQWHYCERLEHWPNHELKQLYIACTNKIALTHVPVTKIKSIKLNLLKYLTKQNHLYVPGQHALDCIRFNPGGFNICTKISSTSLPGNGKILSELKYFFYGTKTANPFKQQSSNFCTNIQIHIQCTCSDLKTCLTKILELYIMCTKELPFVECTWYMEVKAEN